MLYCAYIARHNQQSGLHALALFVFVFLTFHTSITSLCSSPLQQHPRQFIWLDLGRIDAQLLQIMQPLVCTATEVTYEVISRSVTFLLSPKHKVTTTFTKDLTYGY